MIGSFYDFAKGEVFHDGLKALEPLGTFFRYYPHEVQLLLLAKSWKQISDEEACVGRCNALGDELGAGLVTGQVTMPEISR